MKRIAKRTTIHGIKEAFYANRIGRIFFAMVFITCAVLMFFQLKGLFDAYMNESIGTKVTNPTALDEVEVPSFYYCNEMWFPNLLGLRELTRNGSSMPTNMYDQMIAMFYKNVSRQNDTSRPFDNHWRLMRMKDLINGILIPLEKGRFAPAYHAEIRPDSLENTNFYDLAHREMNRMLEELKGNSLRNTVLKRLGQSKDKSTQVVIINQTHGIFPNEFEVYPEVLWSLSSIYELFIQLSNRTGNPTLSLDGICWEFSNGPTYLKTMQTVGLKHQHVVSHYGGLGSQLAKLVHLYFTTPGGIEIRNNDSTISVIDRVIVEVERFARFYSSLFSSYLSIATQSEPHLLFNQKLHIGMHSPRVHVRYWTKKSVLKSRKGSPCRSENWIDLDQAHCNQRDARERADWLCEQYLPASNHFQETNITSQTCIYDHTGLFELGKSAASKQPTGSRVVFPLHVSSASRQEVLVNLTANSVSCPMPCSKTLYQFEATYPTSERSQRRAQCMFALAYFFVPLEDVHEVWWGNRLRPIHEINFKSYIFWRAMLRIEDNPIVSAMFDKWPCSVVEFERSETHGQIAEEYFLYRLSDLAANVGGTMALWIGTSVISIVQLIYLCCLKRLFRRVRRCRFKHLTKCVGHLSKVGVEPKRENKTNSKTGTSRGRFLWSL